MNPPLAPLNKQIVECRLCARLVEHREEIARTKRKAYQDQAYWGRPVPGFGDPGGRLLIVGLAPGAHGANRTGRMFTGDSSGNLLYAVLYETGFASQPTSTSIDDGLQLIDAYITAPVRCAPPDNKPTPEEARTCRPYLHRELDLLLNIQVVVALGRLGFDSYLSVLAAGGGIERRSAYQFGHGAEYKIAGRLLIASYHPSQQNTSTGKLTRPMFAAIFQRARRQLT